MNVGSALLGALKNAGARAIFGIPGDYVLPFFDIIEESRTLPLFTFSHEPAVGHAADAAARHGGGIGVAVVTYGAGALSMVNAAACAWAERSPLVIISGAPGVNEDDQQLKLHHQLRRAGSQVHIFSEITCARTVLDDARQAPVEIARVLRECRRQSQPVYIELPRDMVYATSLPVPTLCPAPRNETSTLGCAEKIAELVSAAARPAILADVEIRRYGLENTLLAVARKAGIPVATTFMGKGMFAGKGSPFIGTYLGAAGDSGISDIIEDSDCLIMLGVIASDTNLGLARKRVDLSRTLRVNEGQAILRGDTCGQISLAGVIRRLGELLPGREVVTVPARHTMTNIPVADGCLRADDVAGLVNAQLAASSAMPVAVDVGDCLFVAMGVQDVPVLASGYYATMGFGIPAGLGIQAATGERPLVIAGDGGFQMTGWELLNCGRGGLDPVVLVLNNGGWGMLKEIDPQVQCSARNGMSYTELAQALGGTGYAARTPAQLAEALHKAFATRGKFQLVEAILPAQEVSTTLKKFIAALKNGKQLQVAA